MKSIESSNEKRILKKGKLKYKAIGFNMKKYTEDSKQIIRKASANNKLVVFVGSGVSANSGIPMWNGIINEIKERIDFDSENEQDNLVIAQYFYNSRGEKEYYDLLKDKLDLDVEPNELDDKILELNPYHIITTNYDNLIESQATKKGMFYDVVSKDSDLPYTPNGRMIIKMHGDFTNRNIVFKEDDYLSYSNNFKLIETFIKSIFATHTVLFVGYSLKDPDIKYIFKWVKDILKKDLPRPYFLKIDDSKGINMAEYQYYQNMGVNLLYYSQIDKETRNRLEDKNKTMKYDTGRKTLSFIEYLLDDIKDKFTEDDFYKYTQEFKYINYIDRNDFIKFLRNKFGLLQGENFVFEEESKFVIYGSEDLKNQKVNELINIITSKKYENENKEFFKKLYIKTIEMEYNEVNDKIGNVEKKRKVLLVNNENFKYTDIDEALMLYKINDLEKIVNDVTSIDGDLKNDLQIAYVLYFTGQYPEAYKKYKTISNQALNKKEYFVYGISEFNRFYCGRIVISHYIYDINTRKEIEKELEKIDLDSILLKWPLDLIQNDILKNIINWNYIYKKSSKITDLKPKIDENENTLYGWISKERIAINQLSMQIRDFWRYANYNFLAIDNYVQVRSMYYNYIDILIKNYMLPKQSSKESFFGKAETVKIEKITVFDVMCMIRYIEKKELENIFVRYNVKLLELVEEDVENVVELMSNVLEVLKNNTRIKRYDVRTVLLLLSKINLKSVHYNKINKKIEEYYDSKGLKSDELTYLNRYIYYQYEKFDNYDFEFYNIILKKILSKYEAEIDDNDITIINNLTAMIKEKESKKVFIEYETIINQFEVGKSSTDKILIYFNRICSKAYRNKLSKKINNYLNKKENLNTPDCELYYEAVMENVISSNDKVEKKFLEQIDRVKIEKESQEKKGVRSYPDIVKILLEKIGIFKLDQKLINISQFNKFLGIYDYFDFIYDIDNFNYSKFNIDWIDTFGPRFLKELSNNDKFKKEVTKQIKEKNSKGENINDEIINKFIKYFI